MRIAVTGPAGFVGGAVVAAARARGHDVVALTRREWDVTTGPLPDPPAVDAVVHAAAAVTERGAAQRVWAANLLGTRHVAASFPGVRLVHVSTASVYDPFVATVAAREDAAPVARYLNAYGASKAAAERLLRGRPGTVVLRPHAVYGPGDPTLLPRLLAAARSGTLVLPGPPGVRHTLTAVGTLADAALRACDPAAPPGVYNVGDVEPVVLADVVAELFAERARGRAATRPVPADRPAGPRGGGSPAGRPGPLRIVHIPPGPAGALARVVEGLVPAERPLRLTRYAVSQLGYEHTLDLTAARTRLGLIPPPTSVRGAAGW